MTFVGTKGIYKLALSSPTSVDTSYRCMCIYTGLEYSMSFFQRIPTGSFFKTRGQIDSYSSTIVVYPWLVFNMFTLNTENKPCPILIGLITLS